MASDAPAGACARVKRPWHVTVTRPPLDIASAVVPRADVDGCRSRLEAALVRNRMFAETRRLAPWAMHFDPALAVLDEDAGRAGEAGIGHDGILNAAAYRLLQAFVRARCFGGMGTWNDIKVADRTAQEEQFDLATELDAAVIDAIQQATWPGAAARMTRASHRPRARAITPAHRHRQAPVRYTYGRRPSKRSRTSWPTRACPGT